MKKSDILEIWRGMVVLRRAWGVKIPASDLLYIRRSKQPTFYKYQVLYINNMEVFRFGTIMSFILIPLLTVIRLFRNGK